MNRSAFYTSRLLGQVGQGLFLSVLVMIGGGTSTAALGFSAILVAMIAASVIFGLPAGVLIDRVGPSRALVFGGLLRMIAIGSAAWALGRPEYAAAVAFMYSAASQVFSPSELALVRRLYPERAGHSHAWLIALQHAGQAAGALALAPVLYLIGGVSLMIAGGVSVYGTVVLIALLLALRLQRVAPVARRPSLAWGEAVDYFRREHLAGYAIGMLTFAEVATKSMAVALPFYLRDDLNLAPAEIAVLAVLGAAGVLAGLIWTGRALTVHVAPRAMRLALIATVASTLALVGLAGTLVGLARLSPVGAVPQAAEALDLGFMIAMPAAVLLGLCMSIGPVGARTIFSETAPPGMQGRIFTTQAVVTDLMVIAPLMIAGAVTGFAGARPAMLLVAMMGAAVFVVFEWTIPRRRAGVPATVPIRN